MDLVEEVEAAPVAEITAVAITAVATVVVTVVEITAVATVVATVVAGASRHHDASFATRTETTAATSAGRHHPRRRRTARGAGTIGDRARTTARALGREPRAAHRAAPVSLTACSVEERSARTLSAEHPALARSPA